MSEAQQEPGVRLMSSSPEQTYELGRRVAVLLRAGDVVLLVGALGSGKTTFTRGLGAALDVRGEITSPTFVLARVHRNTREGPDLIHVDAYRLRTVAELDDLDIDSYTDSAVTVVEWGDGIGERLSDSWLRVDLTRDTSSAGDNERVVTVSAHGPRWKTSPVRELLSVAKR